MSITTDSARPSSEPPATPISRRSVIGLGLAGTASFALSTRLFGGGSARGAHLSSFVAAGGDDTPPLVPRFQQLLRIPPEIRSSGGVINIEQKVARQRILPAPFPETGIWGYNGMVPGPTIRQTRGGSRTELNQRNSLPEPVSVHLHGSPSQPFYDGHPEDLLRPGTAKLYKYPNEEEARTMWYHDHALHVTAEHVYKGLAGFFIQEPSAEDVSRFRLDQLPSGAFDIPLMFHDMQFTSGGEPFFDDDGHKDLFGNVALVNATPWPRLNVATRKYRFRFLVGSLSRVYRFSLSNGMPFTIIGTEDSLLNAPVRVTSFRQAPAERYEVVIDFSGLNVGDRVTLLNQAAEGAMREVMQFVVDRKVTDTTPIPSRLNDVRFPDPSKVVQRRHFRFERSGSEWVINGKTYESSRIDARPRIGDTELWTLENSSGGWSHPVHIHMVDFQIRSRNGRPPFAYERGLKDMVYLGPNETAQVLIHFSPPPAADPTRPTVGRYVMHCHNVVHEDHDMMNQFETRSGATAARASSPHSMMVQWELQA